MNGASRDGDVGDLAALAHDHHVVVVGGGVAGIVAALECAKIGMRVTLVEASDRLGGAVRAIDAGGLELDAAAEGWSKRGGSVRRLVAELGLDDLVVASAEAPSGLAGLPGGPVPLPERTIAGIPENPWDESVRRIIGWSGAWRAYVDRVRPPLTIGKERSLGTLVRTRMGEAVLDRLVAPFSLGVWGTHPDDIDVEAVAPGLSTALTRTGSLSGAVADLLVDRPSGPRLEGLSGGMTQLVAAAETRLAELGAEVRRGVRIAALERAGRAWSIRAEPAASDLPDLDPADHVIVAVPEHEARRLLAPHVPALDAPVASAHPFEVVTLVVAAPRLGDDPRAAVYPVPGTHRAVAVVDSTVRWPWLAERAGSGIHVLRVSFGSAREVAATAGLDDASAFALAHGEASALLGAELEVRGAARERFDLPRPVSVLGLLDAAAAARGAIHAVRGLAAVGAWLSGSGLAQVVPDAVAEAEVVRRRALFGSAE